MTAARIKEQALALEPEKRLRLVQDIWDSLLDEGDAVQVPDDHVQLVNRRLAEHKADPTSAISLVEAKRRVRSLRSPKRKQ